jgi:hypothetical protein
MATLTADITADARQLEVTGDVSASRLGQQYRIDDEVVTLRDYVKVDINGNPDYRGTRDPQQWYITRGDAGTTAATHSAGASIVAVEEAVAVSTTLVEPLPFAGAGGVATPAAFVEPTTATPEAIAQALIDAGLMASS